MYGGLPQPHCQITSGLAGEEELCVPQGTIQTISVRPNDPKYSEVFATILCRLRTSVPCATIKNMVRKIDADEYLQFRHKSKNRSTTQTLMGFTSSPNAFVTQDDFKPRFIGGKEGMRRRPSKHAHLIPSPEPPIYVSPHALTPLFLHTGERERDGCMILAFGEYALPQGDNVPHFTNAPTPNPMFRYDNRPTNRQVLGSIAKDIFRGQYMLTDPTLFYGHYVLQVELPQVRFGMDVRISHCRTSTHLTAFNNILASPASLLEDDQLGIEMNAYNVNPFAQPHVDAGGWKRKCLCAAQYGHGDWFQILRTTETAQQNHDVVKYGDVIRLQHKDNTLFLGVVEAESQTSLTFDQTSDERQHHVCFLPNTYQPEWKAKRINWVVSWEDCHEKLPLCFFPSPKAGVYFTNQATNLKLHSHDLPLFGENALEVTAFHVAKDPNNSWAITGIHTDDPFLHATFGDDQLSFIGHPSQLPDQDIITEEMALEEARSARLIQYYREQAALVEADDPM